MERTGIMLSASDAIAAAPPLTELPLVTLYFTERCNSRCRSCDWWRHGSRELDDRRLQRLLPQLRQLQTEFVLVSGGEPLLHRQWRGMAEQLRANGQRLWLLTAGISLSHQAADVVRLFERITVSLDGANAATYAAIRGIDAFEPVCAGIRALAGRGRAPSLRVTVQRRNFRELSELVRLARTLRAASISFLAIDVGSERAFGRDGAASRSLLPEADELSEFEAVLEAMERVHADEFARGFIQESPAKLRRLLQYFRACHGLDLFPPVRCNAPEMSAVIDAAGAVHPCFFIAGPAQSHADTELADMLNSGSFRELRSRIALGQRAECARCVCSLWCPSGRLQ